MALLLVGLAIAPPILAVATSIVEYRREVGGCGASNDSVGKVSKKSSKTTSKKLSLFGPMNRAFAKQLLGVGPPPTQAEEAIVTTPAEQNAEI